ncbi:MAG TPA: methyltransferase domain-containing protein [Propionibacteriaceae bacterium]|nr:methyltransferase domain-containing protein [Propionibacteriaceae bacterium]
MAIRDRLHRALARQLGSPSGLAGVYIARRLNRNNRTMVLAAAEAGGVAAGYRAADIGFGGGLGLRELLRRVSPGGHVIGVDASATVLRRARRVFRRELASGSLTVVHGSASDLPLPTDSLDVALTVNTIYFMPDLAPPFAELARVVRPRGRVVVCAGDPTEMAKAPATAYGFVLRPISDVCAALTAAGFTAIEQHRGGEGPEAFHVLTAQVA